MEPINSLTDPDVAATEATLICLDNLRATRGMQNTKGDPNATSIPSPFPHSTINSDQNVTSVAPQLVDGPLDEIGRHADSKYDEVQQSGGVEEQHARRSVNFEWIESGDDAAFYGTKVNGGLQ